MTPTDSTGSFPADTEGAIYYDDSEALLKHYDGNIWKTMAGFSNSSSIVFNSSNFVSVPDDASLRPSTFTIALWFKFDADGQEFMINKMRADQGDTGVFIDHQAVNGRESIRCEANINGNKNAYGDTDLNPDTWYHVAVKFDGTNLTILLNGSQDGTPTNCGNHTPDLGDGGEPLEIGGRNGSANYNGKIDEVAFWNTALSNDAIASVYNEGSPFNLKTDTRGDYTSAYQSNLVGYWRLEGNLVDSSGQGNDGSMNTGTATYSGDRVVA
jgi:hypothetical protein